MRFIDMTETTGRGVIAPRPFGAANTAMTIPPSNASLIDHFYTEGQEAIRHNSPTPIFDDLFIHAPGPDICCRLKRHSREQAIWDKRMTRLKPQKTATVHAKCSVEYPGKDRPLHDYY